MNRRQQAFAEAYLLSLNATEAAKVAGYSARTSHSIGQRLLKNVEVTEHIAQGLERQRQERTAQIEEIREFWTETMRNKAARVAERLKSSELLGKSYGMFLERVEVDGNMNIQENLEKLTDEELRALASMGDNSW